jgi:hypothetical protein
MLKFIGKLFVFEVATVCAQETRKHSISGQSAGGSMAMQHLFAFSSQVEGALIAAGSPYGCGSQEKRNMRCTYGRSQIHKLNKYIEERFADDLIDNPKNLTNTTILLFQGQNDWEVYPQVMKEVENQLSWYVKKEKVITKFDTKAAHVWSVDLEKSQKERGGNCKCGACAIKDATVKCCDVNNCGYDLSGDFLKRVYSGLKPSTTADLHYFWVDQWKFVKGVNSRNAENYSHLMEYGFFYVPKNCELKASACKLHIHYHGCMYRNDTKREKWSNLINLNEHAESNDIVIFYPQASGDKRTSVGCWNWEAYKDDEIFDTR